MLTPEHVHGKNPLAFGETDRVLRAGGPILVDWFVGCKRTMCFARLLLCCFEVQVLSPPSLSAERCKPAAMPAACRQEATRAPGDHRTIHVWNSDLHGWVCKTKQGEAILPYNEHQRKN